MKINIVNFKTLDKRNTGTDAIYKAFGTSGFYVGRRNSFYGLPKSPLANPFRIADYGGNRGAVLVDYRKWLWNQIKNNNMQVINELNRINDELEQSGTVTLICWCDCTCDGEMQCHGEIIRNALNSDKVQAILSKQR